MDREGSTNEAGYYSDIDEDEKLRAGTSYINGINGINLSSLDVGASDNEALIDNDAINRKMDNVDNKVLVGVTEMHPTDSNNMINEAKDQMKKRYKDKDRSDSYIDFKDNDYGNGFAQAMFDSFGGDINNDATLKIRDLNDTRETPATLSPPLPQHPPPVAPKPNISKNSHLYPNEIIEEMSHTNETKPLGMYHDTRNDATDDCMDSLLVDHSGLPMENDLTNLYSFPASKPPSSPPRHTYENGPFHTDYLNANKEDSMNNNKGNITAVNQANPTGSKADIATGLLMSPSDDDQSQSERQVETTTDNNSTGASVSNAGPVRYNGSIILDRDGDSEYPTRCIIKDRSQQRRSIFENEILESFVPCVRRDTARERLWATLSNETTILCLSLIALITSVTKITLTTYQLSRMGLITVTFLEVFAAISSLALRTAEAWFKMDDEKSARDIELVMRIQRQKKKKPSWVYTSGTSPALKKWRKKLVVIEVTLGSVIILGFVICAVRNTLLVTVLTTNIPLFIGDILGRMSIYHLNIGLLRIKQDHLKMALTESLYLLQDNAPSIKRKRFINSVKSSFYFPAYIDIPRLEQITVGRELGAKTETSFETLNESVETSLMALA